MHGGGGGKPVSNSLGMRAHRSDGEHEEDRRPDGERASAEGKHSLDEIARRLADLDRGAGRPRMPPPNVEESGQRLAATLDRVGGLIARLQAQSTSGPDIAAPPHPEAVAPPMERPPAERAEATRSFGDEERRREASRAFRERLAAIRAEFDHRRSAPAVPGAAASGAAPLATGDDEAVEFRSAAPRPVAEDLPPALERPERPADLQSALADIRARQRRLDEDGVDTLPTADPAAEDGLPESDERAAPMAALQREIAALTERIEKARPERTREEVRALRSDLGEMSRAFEGLPARHDALARGLDVITARVDMVSATQVSASDFAQLRTAVAEATETAASAARPEAVDRLAQRLDELAGRIADNTAGIAAARRLEEQAQLLAGHLDSLPTVADVTTVAEQVEALAHEVAAVRQTAAPQFEELRAETSAIRSRLGEAERARLRLEADMRGLAEAGPAAQAVQRLGERLSGLTQRVEEMATAVRDQATLDRIDLARIERNLSELSSRYESSTQSSQAERIDGFEEVVRELAARLESAPPADDARISKLETAIRDLAERIEIAGAPGAGPDAIHVLERHVDRLAEQMASLQEVTIAASERAAMAAVQKSGGEIGGSHVEALAHHLQALNKATAASERRTQSTLEAMHETLDKVVARMAVLEEEVARRGDRRTEGGSPPGSDFRAALERARERVNEPPDDLLEPGTGRPIALDPEEAAQHGQRPPRGVRSVDFIAAARRAVQSAAAESRSDYESDVFGESRGGAVRQMARIGRRPVVLGIAALVLMMGVMQIVSLNRNGGGEQVAQNAAPKPAPQQRVAAADRPVPAPKQQERVASSPQPQRNGIPLPDPMPPDAVADPDMTASIPGAAPSPSYGAPQNLPEAAPPAGAAQLPREIGGARLRTLASGGDPGAEYEVAVRYAEGRGVTADYGAAAYWLERAARQNFAPAQYRLAAMYQAGQGVAKDLEAARRWYERAGLLGHLGAMHNLAVMYAEGALGTQDYRQAAAWFRRAAERGLTDSQVNLGVLLSLGLGVKQDLVEAYKWLAIAAAKGDTEAAAQRDGIEDKLDAASLARAKQLVETFTPLPSDPAANVVTPPQGGWDTARLGNAG